MAKNITMKSLWNLSEMRELLEIFLLVALAEQSLQSFCGSTGVPFSFEVLPSGKQCKTCMHRHEWIPVANVFSGSRATWGYLSWVFSNFPHLADYDRHLHRTKEALITCAICCLFPSRGYLLFFSWFQLHIRFVNRVLRSSRCCLFSVCKREVSPV